MCSTMLQEKAWAWLAPIESDGVTPNVAFRALLEGGKLERELRADVPEPPGTRYRDVPYPLVS